MLFVEKFNLEKQKIWKIKKQKNKKKNKQKNVSYVFAAVFK